MRTVATRVARRCVRYWVVFTELIASEASSVRLNPPKERKSVLYTSYSRPRRQDVLRSRRPAQRGPSAPRLQPRDLLVVRGAVRVRILSWSVAMSREGAGAE